MATLFPQQIQTFIEKYDITASDAENVKLYQQAMENGDIALAETYLQQIADYKNKIITAEEMNTIIDTCVAVQDYFVKRYSPAYIVSETKPTPTQDIGDFWFEVTSVEV